MSCKRRSLSTKHSSDKNCNNNNKKWNFIQQEINVLAIQPQQPVYHVISTSHMANTHPFEDLKCLRLQINLTVDENLVSAFSTHKVNAFALYCERLSLDTTLIAERNSTKICKATQTNVMSVLVKSKQEWQEWVQS